MIWSDSPVAVLVTAVAGAATIWFGYAAASALLRRAVFTRNQRDAARNERRCTARPRRAAAVQVFLLSWVWILHAALAAWLILPHEWWMAYGSFVALMAGVGVTFYRVLGRFDEIRDMRSGPPLP